MTVPTWQFVGDEHLQSMFRYMRDPIAGRVVADVIGSAGGTYASWVYKGVGEMAARSRSGLEIYVDDERAPVVVLVLGTNPRPSATLPPDFARNVREAVALAGKHGAQVVLIGPFANDPGGRRFAALRDVVPDAIDGMALAAGLLRASDGVGFTQPGYRTLAARMVDAVFRTIDNRTRPPSPGPEPGGASELEVPPEPETGVAKSRSPYTVPLLVLGGVVVAGVVVGLAYSRRRG